jgi:Glycosyl hydrolase-like 10
MRRIVLFFLLALSSVITMSTAHGSLQRIRSVAGYNYSKGAEDPLKVPLGNLGANGAGVAFPWRNFYIGVKLPRVSRINRIEFDLVKIVPSRLDQSSDADVNLEILYSNDNKTYQKYPGKFSVTKKAETIKGKYWEHLVISGLDFNAKYVKLYTPWKRNYYAFGYLPKTMQKSIRLYQYKDGRKVKTQLAPVTKIQKKSKSRRKVANLNFQQISSIPGYNYTNGVQDPLKVPLGNLGASGAGVAFPWKNFYIGVKLPQISRVNRIELDLVKIAAGRKDKTSYADLNLQILFSNDNKSYKKYPGKFTVTKSAQTVDGKYWEYLVISGLNFSARYIKLYTPWKRKYYAFGYLTGTMKKSIRIFSSKDSEITSFKLPFIIGDKLQMPVALKKGNAPANYVLSVIITPGLKGKSDVVFKRKLNKLKNGKNNLNLDLAKYPMGKISLQAIVTDGKTPPTMIAEKSVTALLTRGISSADKLKTGEYRIFQATKAAGADEWTKGTARSANGEIPFLQSASGKLEFKLPAAGLCAIYAGVVGNDSKLNLSINNKKYPIVLERMNRYYNTPNVWGESFVGIVDLKTAGNATLSAVANSRVTYLRIQRLSTRQQALYDSQVPNVPTIVGHQDGHSNFFFRHSDTPEALRKLISRSSKGHQVHSYDWCVGVTTAVNYKSKLTSNFSYKGKSHLDGERHAAKVVDKMIADGFDPLAIVIKQLHKDNVKANVVIRMNAVYPNPTGWSLNGRFYDENPEIRMHKINGRKTIRLSYAYPKMRQYIVAMVKEVLAYNPDGIMLEFMRHPPFFGYDPPLIALYTKRYGSCTPKDFGNAKWKALQNELMTSIIKEIRQAVDAKNPKIQFHVSFDFRNYNRDGLDVATWTKEGLVDAICPGRYVMGNKKLFDLAPFVAMARKSPRKCVIIPRVEGSIVGKDTTRAEELGKEKILRIGLAPNQYRHIMSEFIRMGAVALRPLNGGGSREICLSLANRKELALWEEFKYPVCDTSQNVTITDAVRQNK